MTRDEKWQPTHEQSDRIEVAAKLNNFCVDANGQVLACCDDHKIRVYSQQGGLVDTWDLDFAPQAIGLRKRTERSSSAEKVASLVLPPMELLSSRRNSHAP